MAAKHVRLMLRINAKAKDSLRRYAVRLTAERDRRVSMTEALNEILLKLPLKKRVAA